MNAEITRSLTLSIVPIFLALTANGALGKNPLKEKPPTFNHDVAPIVFSQCVACHHPGGLGPFSLTGFADVKKRAKMIATVTASRYMPPWLPEPGHGEFAGVRRLTDEQIAMIARWAKAGSPEGAPGDLNETPHWSDDWQLGKPDLVVTMQEAYTLAADGRDVYRNFVIPNAIPANVYLRAMEMRPGNRGVHHGSIFFDDTGSARRLAVREKEAGIGSHEPSSPGFPGMNPGDGARPPAGMFTAWQPGKGPSEAPPGLSAPIHKGADIVLQLHMRPTGKGETISPSIALYFTERAPTRSTLLLALRSVQMDIPPGAADCAVESSYKLPVDVEALAVAPHMHYLGKEIHGWADLPNGTRQDLILITRWDFNWQGDYRYAAPVPLPEGSTIHMRCTYDNSAANVRNPNQPPKRVTYGLQSSDEMGELWLQLVPEREADMQTLDRDYYKNWVLPDTLARGEVVARLEPKNVENRINLAAALAVSGRLDEAVKQVRQAIEDNPGNAPAHYLLSQILIKQNKPSEAKTAIERSVELEPANAKAQGDLGWILLNFGEVLPALEHLQKAVDLNPTDPLAQLNLKKALSIARDRLRIQPVK